MNYIYKYTDICTHKVEYVGKTNDLERRIRQHKNLDNWASQKTYNIYYMPLDVDYDLLGTIEGFYIQNYDTRQFLNKNMPYWNYETAKLLKTQNKCTFKEENGWLFYKTQFRRGTKEDDHSERFQAQSEQRRQELCAIMEDMCPGHNRHQMYWFDPVE